MMMRRRRRTTTGTRTTSPRSSESLTNSRRARYFERTPQATLSHFPRP
jgi:hypothetical protein